MTVLDTATTPQALDIPRYRLHPLKGDLKGFWSVTVRANWRIIFRFEEASAGVIWNVIRFEMPVIPAKARIQSVGGAFPNGLRSRFPLSRE
jgi:hypothetical protein